jgi:hypothetical protein
VPRSVVRYTSDILLGTPLDVVNDYLQTFDGFDKRPALLEFRHAVVLVFNGRDDILTPPSHSELIVEGIPGAEHIVVNDAGHVIMLEHPDLLDAHLMQLVEQSARARAEQIEVARHPRVRRIVTDVAKNRASAASRRRPPSSSGRAAPSRRAPGGVSTWSSRCGGPRRRHPGLRSPARCPAARRRRARPHRRPRRRQDDPDPGIAEGLGVRGPITSPTFVIARVHPSLVGGPLLVHVDAYRLGSAVELDDLDLDADLDASVTIVEWARASPNS